MVLAGSRSILRGDDESVNEANTPRATLESPERGATYSVRPGEREAFEGGDRLGSRGAGGRGHACGTTWSHPAGQSFTCG